MLIIRSTESGNRSQDVQQRGQVDAKPGPNGSFILQFHGALTVETLSGLWASSVSRLSPSKPRQVIVDLSSVSNLDGAGLGLLAEIRRVAASWNGDVSFRGVTGELGSLLRMSALSDPEAKILRPPAGEPRISMLGRRVDSVFRQLVEQVSFTGELLAALGWAVRNPHEIRYRDLWLAAEKAGVNALPIILLLGLLIGMIVAFLAASVLRTFGAISMIPMIVSVGMVREFAPLMTAVFLSGRSGSYFAAEIGTMKVTEELDALETFGLNKVRFLVIPRVLAAMLTTPMLTVFFMFSGLLGGFLVCRLFDIPLPLYISTVKENVSYVDVLGGLAKAVVFALIVASIGCLHGFQTGKGPGAVGVSTTRTLVSAVALIVFVDGILGALYYFVGI